MLRFPAESAFEAWLEACPLDRRLLTYSVTRTGDGNILNVQCNWRTPAIPKGGAREAAPEAAAASVDISEAAPAPEAAVDADEEARAEEARAAEAARLRATLAKMQSLMATYSPMKTSEMVAGGPAALKGQPKWSGRSLCGWWRRSGRASRGGGAPDFSIMSHH